MTKITKYASTEAMLPRIIHLHLRAAALDLDKLTSQRIKYDAFRQTEKNLIEAHLTGITAALEEAYDWLEKHGPPFSDLTAKSTTKGDK